MPLESVLLFLTDKILSSRFNIRQRLPVKNAMKSRLIRLEGNANPSAVPVQSGMGRVCHSSLPVPVSKAATKPRGPISPELLPPSFSRRLAPRPAHRKTPAPAASRLLSRLSRPRIAAPRRAARHCGRPSRRAGDVASAAGDNGCGRRRTAGAAGVGQLAHGRNLHPGQRRVALSVSRSG